MEYGPALKDPTIMAGLNGYFESADFTVYCGRGLLRWCAAKRRYKALRFGDFTAANRAFAAGPRLPEARRAGVYDGAPRAAQQTLVTKCVK